MTVALPQWRNAETADTVPVRLDAAIVACVRQCARLMVRWMRAVWQSDGVEPAQGLAIPHADVDRALADPQERVAQWRAFLRRDAEAQRDAAAAEAACAALERHPDWLRLTRAFLLTQTENALLSLCLAVELAPELLRVCGYLHDDAAACYPSRWLAALLFEWPDRDTGWPPVARGGSLLRWQLAQRADGASSASAMAPWAVDPAILAWVSDAVASAPGVERADTTAAAALPCLYPAQVAELQGFVENVAAGLPVLVEIIGPPGSGRHTLAAQLCAALGMGMLRVDAAAAGEGSFAERSLRALRMARLERLVPCWHGLDPPPPGFREATEGTVPLMILVTEAPAQLVVPALYRRVRLPALRQPEQLAMWHSLTQAPPPPPVSEWQLLPVDIVNAALAVPNGPVAVLEACRGRSSHATSELFAHLPCPYTWDDIVLPPATRQHLAELEQQAQLRVAVYEGWGFERLCPIGRGITAMFAGPSGTGKTMAAQVMARSLGLELYRVDLAGVMNKYIGETEKRIKQVFEICARGNVLLFFDEADALFGQRTQVKDAHDRFANIEIDYLLQRMEQFDGIAVLATNRKNDLDRAFLRRIRFIVDFMQPGPAERLAIWRRVLPDRAPDGTPLLEAIDWDLLAEKLTMTGADITVTALNAAFAANAEGGRIGMRHVLHSARRELTKHGIVLRTNELGEA